MRLVARLVDEEVARDDSEDADRDVDEEDPAPLEVLGDETAHQRADRERERGRAGPDADRSPAFARRKRRGDDRERRGVHQRGAGSLKNASADEHLGRVGEAAQERRQGEDDDPGDEDPPAPVGVGDLAADQHQRRERQRVAGDDPFELREVGAEVALDRGQRDVHDGVVEHDHEEAERDRRQRQPLAVLLCEDPSPHAAPD